MLKKNLTLYERNEKGELIPQTVNMILAPRDLKEFPQFKGEQVSIIPLKRGELKALFNLDGKAEESAPETDKDTDAELILSNCKNPAYTKEELVVIKPVILRSIARTILSESGIKFDDKVGTKSIDDNDELGKNLKGLDEKKEKDV